MKRITPLVLALSLVLWTTACGDDDDEADTASALDAVCEQQEEVVADLQSLAALDPAVNTTDEYRSALDELDAAIEDLREARGDLVEQDVDNVTSAYDDLRSDLEGLDDVPVADVQPELDAEVSAQVAELQALYESAYASSDCPE